MIRQLRRIYRKHGIRYFALPLIVILILATVADQVLPDYFERRSERMELADSLERNLAILSLGDRSKTKLDSITSKFETAKKQVIFEADLVEAGKILQDSVRKILESLYFDDIDMIGLSENKLKTSTVVTTGVRFTGVPQQLPRLEAALSKSSHALTMDSMEIRVVDDAKRGGKQLLIIAQISALQMAPLPIASENKAER